jgi:hypothetical protein
MNELWLNNHSSVLIGKRGKVVVLRSLGYDALWSGITIPLFHRMLLPPPSEYMNSISQYDHHENLKLHRWHWSEFWLNEDQIYAVAHIFSLQTGTLPFLHDTEETQFKTYSVSCQSMLFLYEQINVARHIINIHGKVQGLQLTYCRLEQMMEMPSFNCFVGTDGNHTLNFLSHSSYNFWKSSILNCTAYSCSKEMNVTLCFQYLLQPAD